MAASKKRKKFIILALIGLVVVAAVAICAVLWKKEPVITVQTDKVARRNLVELVVANGKIQPVTQVHISPEVSGEIIELPVKEGQSVKKGQLIIKIKPEFYLAALNQAKAGYESAVAGKAQAAASLEKAEADYKRNKELFDHSLISESDFVGYKAAHDVARSQLDSAGHQVDLAKASVDSAQDSLDKTTIASPLDGTISKLNSQLGERVLGTAQNVGTDIMIIADLNEMEARVDVGEMDVGLIHPGQRARLEVDSYKDRKFAGEVTDIASSSLGLYSASAAVSTSSSQDATKFEVRIRIKEKETFRPGMTVTAEIETRYRTNVLSVPIASVTTRPPKEKKDIDPKASPATNSVATNSAGTNGAALAADDPPPSDANAFKADRKSKDAAKPVDVAFVVESSHAKMIPVKIGISDDSYWEILDGLTEGQEIVSGGYKAISRDLEDGKKIKKGAPEKDVGKEKRQSQ